jgi:endonuclease YncB( thermonuclease family)
MAKVPGRVVGTRDAWRRQTAGILAAAMVLGGATAALAGDGPTEAPYTYRAEVVDVIDGDTIDVHIDLGFYVWIRYQRIHLYGIETPGVGEAAGDSAKAHLESLIGGKTVILKSIRGEDSPDRQGSFGNWQGIVYLDGDSINDAMVASGNAVASP